jgi:hypothetical protein
MRVLETGNLSLKQAAGTEQLLIEVFGLPKNGGVLQNNRNEIANPSRSTHFTYDSATVAGANVFRENSTALDQVEHLAMSSGNDDVAFRYVALKLMAENSAPGEPASRLQLNVGLSLFAEK